MKPQVSVIIPTHNRAHVLNRAIDSVLSQTYQSFELIIVDDGSTDHTRKIISHCEAKPKQSGIRDKLRYIQLNQNRGVSHARNIGIKEAQGNWIALLDSDDEWLPKKLELQINFLQSHPDFRIAQTEEIWIRNGKRVNPMNKHKKYSGWIFKECLPLCIVSPSAVMMQKSLLDEMGLFDESLPACEDYDLWLRIAAKYPINLLETPLIIKYGGHEDQLSRRIPNLDIYRIDTLKKILESGNLSEEQAEWTREELKTKCRVYANGCEKRGKLKEAENYRVIARTARSARRSNLSSEITSAASQPRNDTKI